MILRSFSVQSQHWRARDFHKGMSLMTMKKMLMNEAKLYHCDCGVVKYERALASETRFLERKKILSIKLD